MIAILIMIMIAVHTDENIRTMLTTTVTVTIMMMIRTTLQRYMLKINMYMHTFCSYIVLIVHALQLAQQLLESYSCIVIAIVMYTVSACIHMLLLCISLSRFLFMYIVSSK
jgi:hypothetical protein